MSRSTDRTDDARDRVLEGDFPISFFSKNLSKLRTPPGPKIMSRIINILYIGRTYELYK